MDIVISNADIVQVSADLLVLKHADGFYGADQAVAQAIGFDERVPEGTVRSCRGTGLATPEVLFIGVGPLRNFRYQRIQEFGAQAIKLAGQHQRAVRHLALTIHGPGYGLDPEQSFLSMVAGVIAEWKKAQGALQRVTIAERSKKRCELLSDILAQHLSEFGLAKTGQRTAVAVESVTTPESRSVPTGTNILHFGARVEDKPRLFVAMPFAEEYVDEFEIAFCEAAKASEYICERLDLESFTGDIVTEIKRRQLRGNCASQRPQPQRIFGGGLCPRSEQTNHPGGERRREVALRRERPSMRALPQHQPVATDTRR